MQKLKIFLFLILPLSLFAGDQTSFPYISPGLRLGYTFGEGFTWGLQLTAGVISKNLPISGVTMGYSRSRSQSITFIDYQISAVYFGSGYGLAFIRDKAGNEVRRYNHIKAWGGMFALLQYDYYFVKQDRYHALGTSLVFPFFDLEGVTYW